VKAGTIILVCNAAVFIMQSFDWSFQLVEEGMEKTSILATIASPIAYLLVPVVGITAWQLAAAAVTGFIAKENVVGTLAVCYGFAINDDLEMVGSGNDVAATMVGLTKVAALAYLMFNLFTPPCFAALGAMNAEIKQKKWFWGGIGLQLATGYTVGYLVYTIGTLITAPDTLNVGAAIGGLLFVVAFVIVLACLCSRADRSIKAELGAGRK
jgi:ferrous iron transport protein B